jgi:iron complex transport system substrate-binding protein
MKWLAVIAALAFSTAAVAAPLPRVASVSVCGDIYALMLADRGQIAAVSLEAEGPLASYPDRAHGLPRNRGDLESLLAAHADLVLLEEGAKPQLVQALQRLGIRTFVLPLSANFAEIAQTTQAVADAMGQHARGEAAVSQMMARIRRLQAARALENQRPIALYFRPDGGGTGGGTYMDSLITLAGYRNLQTMLGQEGWHTIPLESIVQHPPQVFITGFFETQASSVAGVRGSKLDVVMKDHAPVVSLPGRGMACASPALVDVAEQAATMRRKLFAGGVR